MNYQSSSNVHFPGWLRVIDGDEQGIVVVEGKQTRKYLT
jgi:hypothetical protein